MDSLRLSDAERDEAVARLGEHFAAGRLDKDEYDERSDAVWSARTRGELRPVFADLEAAEARFPSVVRPPSPRHRPAPWLLVLVALGVLTALTHLPIILLGLIVWCLLRYRHPHRRC